MDKNTSSSGGTGWKLLVGSGFSAVAGLFLVVLMPDLLIVFFFVLFVVSMVLLVLESIGAKRHGDEWVDWRTEPVEPVQNLSPKPERAPLFSEVADPENFPHKLPTAWKRRKSIKERHRFVTDRKGLPGG